MNDSLELLDKPFLSLCTIVKNEICQRGLEWCPNYPPVNYLAAGVLRNLGFSLAAIIYLKNCIQLGEEESYYKGDPFDLSFMTTYPSYEMGCTYLELSRYESALAAFEMALSFDANFTAARDKIEQVKEFLANQN